jgi:hypothetical protein
MANGIVQVQPDSTGKKIQTFENTVGSNVVESQGVVLVDTAGAALKTSTTGALAIISENSNKATYCASVSGQANTAASDSIVIESGTTKIVRIRKILILNPGTQTTAGFRVLQLLRTTTAGSAGAITPIPFDASDAAFSGIVRAKPTSLGTAGVVLMNIPVWVPAAGASFAPMIIDFDNDPEKAPTGIAAVANGLALRDPGATGGANFAASIIFTEE